MRIASADADFVPKRFVICEFYNKNTCFCWGDDKLVVFPYTDGDSAPCTEILTAPSTVRNVHCFSSRIFVVCYPCGIYKLSRGKEFAYLSRSGIGMGTVFYEVLTPKDDYLYLGNKQNKSSKQLFRLSPSLRTTNDLCICPLNVENADEQFRKAIIGKENVDNICVIGNGKKLFKLANETARIIYTCDFFIRDLIPIQGSEKIVGLVLVLNVDSVVLMYSRDDELFFDKIHLGTDICALCAGLSQRLDDTIWIIHSDESKLYYTRRRSRRDITQRVKVEKQNFICLQLYQTKFVVGLTKCKELFQLPIERIEDIVSVDTDTFVNLHSDMLKDSDIIIDKVCKKAQELQALHDTLQEEQDILRRINLYAYKQKIPLLPKITVCRIIDRLYLTVNLQNLLPKKAQVVVSLEGQYQRTFCIKMVDTVETVVELGIRKDELFDSMKVVFDLVTLTNDNAPWCLLKNFIDNPIIDKRRGRSKKDKTAFINSKITMLKSLMAKGNVDIKKLSEIKKSVRKEIRDV